jgi:hypothetical protein
MPLAFGCVHRTRRSCRVNSQYGCLLVALPSLPSWPPLHRHPSQRESQQFRWSRSLPDVLPSPQTLRPFPQFPPLLTLSTRSHQHVSRLWVLMSLPPPHSIRTFSAPVDIDALIPSRSFPVQNQPHLTVARTSRYPTVHPTRQFALVRHPLARCPRCSSPPPLHPALTLR